MASAPSKPSPKPIGRSKRPSQSQPNHRRPDWAKTERKYRAYIENPTSRQYNTEDYGEDNFSYNSSHLIESHLDYDIFRRLPPKLAEEVKLFVLALAAVHTAFERIEDLEKEAPTRANPKTSHTHLLSRRPSDQTPAVVGAETPPPSTPISESPSNPPPCLPASKKWLIQTVPQLSVNMAGLESPPFTPVDSKVANTPVYEALPGPGDSTPDLDVVNAQLSRTDLTMTPSAQPIKNEIAWMSYARQYNTEVYDLQKNNVMRLYGYSRTITMKFHEHQEDGTLRMDQKEALKEFRVWWIETEPKVSEIKARVDALEEIVVPGSMAFERSF